MMRNENNLLGAYGAMDVDGMKASRLDKGYVECSAVYRGSSTEYFNTGLFVNRDDEWEVTCCVRNSDNHCVLGGSHDKRVNNVSLWISTTNNQVEFQFGDGSNNAYRVVNNDYDVTKWHTYRMRLSTGEAWIDGTLVGQASSVSAYSQTNTKIGLFYAPRTVNGSANGKGGYYIFKEAKIIRNGVLVRHYVPWYKHGDNGVSSSCGVCDLCNNVYSTISNNIGTNMNSCCHPLFSLKATWVVSIPSNSKAYGLTAQLWWNNATIDWGDGTVETISNGNTEGNFTHTYENAGEYLVHLDSPYSGYKLSLGTSGINYYQKITGLLSVECNVIPSYFCYNARNAKINSKVTEGKEFILDYGFYQCERIDWTSVWDGVYAFGDNSFKHCINLSLTKLPSSLRIINGNALGMTNVNMSSIPEGITNIGVQAFEYCTNLSSLATLPSTLTSIGDHAFEGCSSLALTALPNGLESIGTQSFKNCTSIRSFVISGTVTTIGEEAFIGCSNMTMQSFPTGIRIIGVGAFRSCTSLALTELPNDWTAIPNYCFYGCTSLALLTIPRSVTSIGEYAFYGCSSMTISSLPPNLGIIRTYCFYGCSGITVTAIPSTVNGVFAMAFGECTGLTEINFLSVQSSISATAFSGCSNLLDIYVPWYEGDILNAPWGATYATVHYLEHDSSSSGDSSSSDESSSSSSRVYTKSILPVGYVEADAFFCEYNNSKPYIDTGLINDVTDEWEVTFQHIGVNTGNIPILGGGYAKSDSNYAIWVNRGTSFIEFIFGDGASDNYKVTSTKQYDVTAPHVYKMNLGTGEAWVDGTLLGTANRVSSNGHARKLVLFGCWRGTSNFNSGHGAIKRAKIRRGGELIRDFVPAIRLSDMKEGMYDLCGSTTGQGGTSFYVMSNTSYGVVTYDCSVTYELTSTNNSYGVRVHSPIPSSTVIDWGDGNVSTTNLTSATTLTHSYSTQGSYVVSILSPYGRLNGLSLTDNGNSTRGQMIDEIRSFSGKAVPQQFCNGASNMIVQNGVIDDMFLVGENAFYNCHGMSLTEVHHGIKMIQDNAFRGCDSLMLTEMPVELERVGATAFYGCSLFTSLLFCGNSIITIASDAFGNCNSLETIMVPWSSGDVANAPWGATNATITYDYL